MHILDSSGSISDFLLNNALCDVDRQFERFFTKSTKTQTDIKKIYALSTHIFMPDY